MPQELLKRIIEHASDSLARNVYRRMLMDRRAARGQLPLRGTVPTWEDIVARAVDEATLTRKEATRLLVEVRDGWFGEGTFGRMRSTGRGAANRTPDRTDGRRKSVRQGPRGKASTDQQSG